MSVGKGEHFAVRDIYIDHPWERVMYRWDHVAEKMFIRRHGEAESTTPVPHDNELVNEALLYGAEISKEEYEGNHSSHRTSGTCDDTPT